MTTFRPMLAGECKALTDLKFPGYASPKLDGIRCIIHPKLGPVTRNLKPIPNRYTRMKLMKPDPNRKALGGVRPQWMPAFDGELIVGDPTNPASWNETSSGIMSEEGRPQFTFFVFDLVDCAPVMTFRKRDDELRRIITKEFRREAPFILHLQQVRIANLKQLREYEETCIRAGYEGVMWRSPDGPYKWGRSTAKEGHLLKIKRFKDTEAVVIGFEEKRHNANAAKTNALGFTERSSHKANQVPMDTLGALVVRATFDTDALVPTPVEFKIGTGFDDLMRKRIWTLQENYMGKVVKFKYQKLSPDGKPIFPAFLGFRED